MTEQGTGLTCDPDRRLHHVVAAPGLLSRHQPVSAEGQVLIIAGHQVPGDGAEKEPRAIQGLYNANTESCFLGLLKMNHYKACTVRGASTYAVMSPLT